MRTIVLALLLGTACSSITAQELIYQGGDHSTPVGQHLEFLVDSAGTLTPEAVLGSQAFQTTNATVPNLGISKNTAWFRFTVRNRTAEPKLFLVIPYPDIDRIDLYRSDVGGIQAIGSKGQAVEHSGSVTTRTGEYVFELDSPRNVPVTYLLRIKGHKQVHLPMLVASPIEAASISARWNLFAGGFLGIMLVMALYNLFVFLSIRDRSYLVYVLYIIINSGAQLTVMGTAQTYLWPDDQWLTVNASVLFVLISIATGILFTQQFISTARFSPRLHRLRPLFHLMILVNVVIYLLVDTTIGYKMAQGISGCASTYLLVMAISSWRAGSRSAGFFLLAWSFFLVGVLVFVMKDTGVLPYNEITAYAMPMGSVVEAILLSFGLADRINILRKEKERSQAEALATLQENERIIREQNVVLEHKVKERTHALQESNDTLKRTQTQLVNAEKMASLGQLTAGIAHEINNPINFITSNVQPLRRNIREIVEVMAAYRAIGPSDADRQLEAVRSKERAMELDESIAELDDIIDSIAEGSSRTAEIVRGLRNFSRLDEDDLKEADLNEGLRSTLAVLAPQFRDKVSIELELGSIPPVECFPGKVNQVFMNVITNAVQATLQRPGERPRVVHVSSIQQDDRVLIRISDNGVGMTDDVKVRIYDPFFTTKPVGEGTGLGMAIVYGIIQDHQGDIRVESSPGVGTEFTIDLPVRHQRANQQRA